MTIHPEILAWSKQRPAWQQDALRRLANGLITPADVAEITLLAMQEYGLPIEDDRQPLPLAEGDHVLNASPDRPVVTLTSISNLRGVNALIPGQTLEIAPAGLTIIYGDNGAGKSGYVRVIKQVCRARGGSPLIHSDVFANDAEPPSATVYYAVDEEHRSCTWTADAAAPPELREVSVFDSHCAGVYVSGEADVAYIPFGLDILPRLTRLCDQVKLKLERQHDELLRSADRWQEVAPGTMAHQALQRLDLAAARAVCEQLATLTDEDRRTLEELRAKDRRSRAENPAGRALELRMASGRISEIVTRWSAAFDILSNKAIDEVAEANLKLAHAREAADLASRDAFTEAPVAGVGTAAWAVLWQSAREFAAQSGPPLDFPPVKGHPCLLCMQPLNEVSATRLANFEAFVRSKVTKLRDEAERETRRLALAIDSVRLDEIVSPAQEVELRSRSFEAATGLAESINGLRTRQEKARTGDMEAAAGIQLHDPRPQLEVLHQQLDNEAKVFESASNPEEQSAVEKSLRELDARSMLSGLFDRIDAQIAREEQCRRTREAIASANTMVITKFSTELQSRAVTQPLSDAFADQCTALKLRHIPISVKAARGEKGTALHSLALQTSMEGDISAEDILSEGEHRCVAIAAFLAEVAVQNSRSSIVLDDPVSSLDHGRRQHVARQLVQLAQARPVVVLTHDLAFLWLLDSTADKIVDVTHRTIRRGAKTPGHVSDDPPWDGLRVSKRIGLLKQALVKLTKLHENDPDLYEVQIRLFYGRLRDSWERAVEEVLLQGAVKRFAPQIKTQSLRKLHRISEEQLVALEAGMTKTSAWIVGHDHAAELGTTVPLPEEALDDLKQLEEWVAGVNRTYN